MEDVMGSIVLPPDEVIGALDTSCLFAWRISIFVVPKAATRVAALTPSPRAPRYIQGSSP